MESTTIKENRWHPKFVERLAKIYVEKYLKNREEAVQWGLQFFPDELVPLIVAASQKELKKRGMRPK